MPSKKVRGLFIEGKKMSYYGASKMFDFDAVAAKTWDRLWTDRKNKLLKPELPR